jgi:hypothetical protein
MHPSIIHHIFVRINNTCNTEASSLHLLMMTDDRTLLDLAVNVPSQCCVTSPDDDDDDNDDDEEIYRLHH